MLPSIIHEFSVEYIVLQSLVGDSVLGLKHSCVRLREEGACVVVSLVQSLVLQKLTMGVGCITYTRNESLVLRRECGARQRAAAIANTPQSILNSTSFATRFSEIRS